MNPGVILYCPTPNLPELDRTDCKHNWNRKQQEAKVIKTVQPITQSKTLASTVENDWAATQLWRNRLMWITLLHIGINFKTSESKSAPACSQCRSSPAGDQREAMMDSSGVQQSHSRWRVESCLACRCQTPQDLGLYGFLRRVLWVIVTKCQEAYCRRYSEKHRDIGLSD